MFYNLLLQFTKGIRINLLYLRPKYKTAPISFKSIPKGIPYIIGNELAERFSFYGMKTILVIFMTKYLADHTGALDVTNQEEALTWYHLFSSGVYITPILGVRLAYGLLEKYRTLITLSILY